MVLCPQSILCLPEKSGSFFTQGHIDFMSYDLVDLKLLVSIVEHGTLGKAAVSNSLASSSASARLNKLESSLGATLFVRHRRGLSLTSAGGVVFRHARAILNKVAEFDEKLASSARNGCPRQSACHSDGVCQ